MNLINRYKGNKDMRVGTLLKITSTAYKDQEDYNLKPGDIARVKYISRFNCNKQCNEYSLCSSKKHFTVEHIENKDIIGYSCSIDYEIIEAPLFPNKKEEGNIEGGTS